MLAGGGAGGGDLGVLVHPGAPGRGRLWPPRDGAVSLAPLLPTLFLEPLLTEVAPRGGQDPDWNPGVLTLLLGYVWEAVTARPGIQTNERPVSPTWTQHFVLRGV